MRSVPANSLNTVIIIHLQDPIYFIAFTAVAVGYHYQCHVMQLET